MDRPRLHYEFTTRSSGHRPRSHVRVPRMLRFYLFRTEACTLSIRCKEEPSPHGTAYWMCTVSFIDYILFSHFSSTCFFFFLFHEAWGKICRGPGCGHDGLASGFSGRYHEKHQPLWVKIFSFSFRVSTLGLMWSMTDKAWCSGTGCMVMAL